jgi:hypothetical protein
MHDANDYAVAMRRNACIHQHTLLTMSLEDKHVDQIQAKRLIASIEQGLSPSSTAYPRQIMLQNLVYLQSRAKDINLSEETINKLKDYETRLTVPPKSTESAEPAVSLRRRQTVRPESKPKTSSTLFQDSYDTTSAERIQILLQAKKVLFVSLLVQGIA